MSKLVPVSTLVRAYVSKSVIYVPGDAKIRTRPTEKQKHSESFSTDIHPILDSMQEMDVDMVPSNGSITITFAGAKMSMKYNKSSLFFHRIGLNPCYLALLDWIRI